jgi:hypothetical protein
VKLQLHPKASQNYNAKAEHLVTLVRPAPDHLNRQGGERNPNIHTVHEFTPKDIIGEMAYGLTDFTGNVIARAFDGRDHIIGLFEGDYIELVRLAEAMNKSITPRGVVSLNLLSELIFDWVKQRHRGISIPPLAEYVLAECEKQIKELEIWIPISHLYIQSAFVFGKITFRAITKAMMDDWEASALSRVTEAEEIEGVRKGIELRRQKVQGLATATIKVEAEPKRAYEIAFEETDKTVSILRFFSPAILHPSKTSYSAPLGSQNEDSYQYLFVDGGKIVGYNSGLTDKSSTHWNLSNEDLKTWSPELGILHMLLNRHELTDFQEAVLNALILYSRSPLAKHISDKLVYMLVGLESIFLKDTGEFIQDAISLRMAYMQDVSVEKRAAIISNVKAVYKLRSSFIHHGQSIGVDESTILTKFMLNAWLSLAALIPRAASNMTKQEFFDSLERRRLSG